MQIAEQAQSRRRIEQFCRDCRLELPREVADLFIEYTKWIWQYKCVGAVYKFYCDETVVHMAGGEKSTGADATVAGTLSVLQAFPDQVTEFIDIFVEGNEKDGYSFGQCTNYNWVNTGHSQYGPPTGKSMSPDGRLCVSMCECRVEKADGRWRIVEEWLVRSHDAIVETCTQDTPQAEKTPEPGAM